MFLTVTRGRLVLCGQRVKFGVGNEHKWSRLYIDVFIGGLQ